MTKWRDEIDRYIGQESKFTSKIEGKKLLEASKLQSHWGYPFTIVAVCLVVFMLFLVGPNKLNYSSNTSYTPIETLINQAHVEKIFISSKQSNIETFNARPSSRYIQVFKFSGTEDVKNMDQFLHELEPLDKEYPDELYTDVLVQMSNGEQLKLKIHNYIVFNVNEKKYYGVKSDSTVKFNYWQEKLETSPVFTIYIVLIIGLFVLHFGLIKLFKLPNGKRKKRNWKYWAIFTLGYLCGIICFYYIKENDIIFHKDISFLTVIVMMVVIGWIDARKKTNKKEILRDRILAVYGLICIWLMLNLPM